MEKIIYLMRIKKADDEIKQINEYILEYGNSIYTAALLVVRSPKNKNGRGATAELMYSGSDDRFFPRFRATINLRYFAMIDCRDKGCDYFNLGGVSGGFDDGLFDFKRKFNPDIYEFIGEFDLVLKPFVYHMIEKYLPKLRRFVNKFKKN